MTTTNKTVLVTGGCGYIGSHTIVLLLEQNYNVVVVDNLVNSSAISLDRVASIVGLTAEQRAVRLVFHQVDICNEAELRKVFEKSPQFASAIHFAGLKVRDSLTNIYFLVCFGSSLTRPYWVLFFNPQAVGESTRMPIRYYENNLIGTFVLLRLMDEFNCHAIVFSSSATGKGHGACDARELLMRWTHCKMELGSSLTNLLL
jgi:UDP-glucose 4-epimerase